MSHHEGVSCDSCMRRDFSGDRFKCLKCFDFDLCRQCYEMDRFGSSSEHSTDHPVQCVLTKDDFDFTYWGEPASSDELRNMTFTCPYCATLGYSMKNLYDHIRGDHTDINYEVICPVCVATPNEDPNRLTDDLVSHLAAEHINRTGRSSTDDTAAAQIIASQTGTGGSRLQRRLIGGTSGNGARQTARRGRPLGLLATAAINGNGVQRTQQYNDAITELLAQTQNLTRRTGQLTNAQGAAANDIYQVLNQQISSRRQRSRQLIANMAGDELDDMALFESMLVRDPGLVELYSQALSSGSLPTVQHVPAPPNDSSMADPSARQPTSAARLRGTPLLSALQQYSTSHNATHAQSAAGASALANDPNPLNNLPAIDASAVAAVQELVTELVPESDDIATLWSDNRYLAARYLRDQQLAAVRSSSQPPAPPPPQPATTSNNADTSATTTSSTAASSDQPTASATSANADTVTVSVPSPNEQAEFLCQMLALLLQTGNDGQSRSGDT